MGWFFRCVVSASRAHRLACYTMRLLETRTSVDATGLQIAKPAKSSGRAMATVDYMNEGPQERECRDAGSLRDCPQEDHGDRDDGPMWGCPKSGRLPDQLPGADTTPVGRPELGSRRKDNIATMAGAGPQRRTISCSLARLQISGRVAWRRGPDE